MNLIKNRLLKYLTQNSLIIGIVSLAWLLYRSGTKPTRITYPCQKAAAANAYAFLVYPFIAFMTNLSKNTVPKVYYAAKNTQRGQTIVLISLLSLSVVSSGIAIYSNIMVNPWNALTGRTTLVEPEAEVSVVRVEDNQIEQSLSEALNYLGGIASMVPEGAKVLIKCNIVRPQAPPDTTDPAIVAALINIIKQRNPSIIWVGDGTGEGDTMQNLDFLGYSSIASIPGIELVDLNYGDLVEVAVPGGGYVYDSFMFNSKVVEADVFISLACMKTHNTAVVTLGMKNLVGITAGSVYGVPGTANHWELHNAAQENGDTYLGGVIADINAARKIDLTIIDGRVAMEGEGPHNGNPVDLGLLIVGTNPVATDTVASTIMGIEPEKVPSLVLSQQKGLGTNDLHRIEVLGESIEQVFRPFATAAGHESFQMLSSTDLLLYNWRIMFIFPAIGFIALTVLSRIRLGRSKERPAPTSSKSKGFPSQQASLTEFESEASEIQERPMREGEVSIANLEKEIADYLVDFQHYNKQIDDVSLRLTELSKLYEEGEIPESAYAIIADDLGKQLFFAVEEAFRLRESLDVAKAKAMMERAKKKDKTKPPEPISDFEKPPQDLRYIQAYSDVVRSDYWVDAETGQRLYPTGLQKWDSIVSRVAAALSSMRVEKEVDIIEQYLSFIRGRLASTAVSGQVEKVKSVCRERLASVSERWSSIRHERIEQISKLDHNASEIGDRIKELEARFSVGELSQSLFESENNKLQAELARLKDEISSTRSYVEDVDLKIFRASELLQ